MIDKVQVRSIDLLGEDEALVQILVPKQLLTEYGIQQGAQLEFEMEAGGITIKALSIAFLEAFEAIKTRLEDKYPGVVVTHNDKPYPKIVAEFPSMYTGSINREDPGVIALEEMEKADTLFEFRNIWGRGCQTQ